MWSWDKQETGRAVQLFFVDLENEQEVDQSFFDMKSQLQESKLPADVGLKTKLVFYSREYNLL